MRTLHAPAVNGLFATNGLPLTVHGGASRTDGKVAFGYALLRGKRGTMEDTHSAQFSEHPTLGDVGTFGIFDGHGGVNAAAYVQRHLFETLLQSDKLASDPAAAVVEAFEATDSDYLTSSTGGQDDGCTAVTAMLTGSRLLVAHVGDSRAVLLRDGKALPLTTDHKPNLREERVRIEAAGGVVVWAGTWRVGGVLAVSRAFGDRPLKRYVIPTPDVRQEELGPGDEVLILASDGLWDVLPNQEAADLVRHMHDPELAARRLAEEAFQRGSADNISCIVLKLRL